jgi:hypothetical protein
MSGKSKKPVSSKLPIFSHSTEEQADSSGTQNAIKPLQRVA